MSIKAEDVKLGQFIYYCNYEVLELYCYKVHAIGKDFFIPEDYQWLLDEYQEVKFKSKKVFLSLREAKNAMQAYYKDLCKKDREFRNMTLKKCNSFTGEPFYHYVDKEKKVK